MGMFVPSRGPLLNGMVLVFLHAIAVHAAYDSQCRWLDISHEFWKVVQIVVQLICGRLGDEPSDPFNELLVEPTTFFFSGGR